NYIIIPKPGKLNKADALSRQPDYKEGIATDNSEKILLTPDKLRIRSLKIDYRFCQYISPAVAHDKGPCDCLSKGMTTEEPLSTTNSFRIQALHTTAIPLAIDTELKNA